MRRTAIAFLALGLTSLALSAPVSATVLLSEGFPYANGGLVANSGGNWTNHSGTGTDIMLSSSRAVCDMAAAPDDNRTFTAQSATTPIYTCFEATVPDPGGIPKLVYFEHLKDSGTTNFFTRVYVAPLDFTAPADSGWTFALSHAGTSATVGVVRWSSTSLVYGKNYHIVTKYDPATTSSKMWVDPVDESSTSVTQVGTTAPVMSAVALRQSSTAATVPVGTPTGSVNWTVSVDNIGIGTTFSDACFQLTPTKISTWGGVKTIYR